MKLALSMLLLVLLIATASAQYTLDTKGRRYPCLPGDRSCSVLPAPSAPLQPSRGQRRPRTQPSPATVEQCGSRCDLLDRMK